MHYVLMAVQTRGLSHTRVARFDLNRIVVVLQSKRQRMEKTIVGFGDPFTNVDQGPQVSEEQFDKILSYIKHGVQGGADLLLVILNRIMITIYFLK